MLRIPAYCGGPIILSFSELFAGPSSHVALPVRSKTPRLSGGTVVKLLGVRLINVRNVLYFSVFLRTKLKSKYYW